MEVIMFFHGRYILLINLVYSYHGVSRGTYMKSNLLMNCTLLTEY